MIFTTKERFKPLLTSLKICAVVAPLILVALIRGADMDGDVALHWLTAGCAAVFFILLFAGFRQWSAGFHKSAYSSFVFAGVSLLWILLFVFLLPSLAST